MVLERENMGVVGSASEFWGCGAVAGLQVLAVSVPK